MLTAVTQADVEVIHAWTLADKFHTVINPEWWLTGQGVLAFKWVDVEGTVFYVRLDENGEDNLYRLNVQFPPRSAVSGERIKTAITTLWPLLKTYADGHLKSGYIFGSSSKSLVRFMTRVLHFKALESVPNEYYWLFEFDEAEKS